MSHDDVVVRWRFREIERKQSPVLRQVIDQRCSTGWRGPSCRAINKRMTNLWQLNPRVRSMPRSYWTHLTKRCELQFAYRPFLSLSVSLFSFDPNLLTPCDKEFLLYLASRWSVTFPGLVKVEFSAKIKRVAGVSLLGEVQSTLPGLSGAYPLNSICITGAFFNYDHCPVVPSRSNCLTPLGWHWIQPLRAPTLWGCNAHCLGGLDDHPNGSVTLRQRHPLTSNNLHESAW